MAALDDLINQIEDEVLRERIRAEVKRANKQKKFGLVFEQHLPEATPLYDVPVKKGSVVALKGKSITDIYLVEAIADEGAICLQRSTKERVTLPLKDLVSVAQFGEPIYPYLQPIDSVCNAPDSDLWHTLIEADNYHALQLLEYLYAGKVDCIYIDPPYNKEDSKDWKYNCNYVDGNDSYRHSKWLSMMSKRLIIAKKLLNPHNSFLIITIDEEEYLHLGCLLEELFPEASIQMISSIIKNGTSMRQYEFSRCNEYIYFLRFGEAVIGKEIPETVSTSIPWRPLMRSGTGSNNFRPARPNSFYPIFVNPDTGRMVEIGKPLLPVTAPMSSVIPPQGTIALWPLDRNGEERVWGASADTLQNYFQNGYAKITNARGKFAVQYITTGVIKDIEEGTLQISGYDDDGGVAGSYTKGKAQMPQNQWDNASHNATTYGTNLLQGIIGSRFTFPKSLYAVRDCIRYAVKNKPQALIVDFFAGSGTTLHAVNLLNAEDGGNRRCIIVTNNEVSADEAKMLSDKGYQPGEPEWESLGIARYVTWPRTVCSIKGVDVKSEPLKGDYLGGDPENPRAMAEGFAANAVFFKLGFFDKTAVSLGRKFKEMLPLLWMKAGARGPCPSLETDMPLEMLILPENQFAVLTEEAMYEEFARKVNADRKIKTIFIVTDSEPGYREMVSGLKVKNTYQLYRDYLDNFRINHSRR